MSVRIYDPDTGAESEFVGYGCEWAEAHPERLVNAPRWLSSMALAGPSFDPRKHCPGCPGYLAAPPRDPAAGEARS